MPDRHVAVFDRYCLDCHDSLSEEGGVNLEDLSFDLGQDIPTAERWQKVLNVLNSGEMPPENKAQLKPAEKTAFLRDLSYQLVNAREILSDSGGVITMRRLNRREYQNTLETLLGVPVDVSALPDDEGTGGFDTNGASLFFSSDQFEQYLSVARKSLREGLLYGAKPAIQTYRYDHETSLNAAYQKQTAKLQDALDRGKAWKAQQDDPNAKPPTEFGFIDADRILFEDGQYERFFPQMWDYLQRPESETGTNLLITFNGALTHPAPLPKKAPAGNYLLRLRAAAHEGIADSERYLEYGLVLEGAQRGEISVRGHRRVTGTLQEPEIIEIPVTVGPHGGSQRNWHLRHRQHNSRDAARRTFTEAKADNQIGPRPTLWIDWIEWEGPHHDIWPPEAAQSLLPERPKEQKEGAYAREVLTHFARTAFRIKEPSDSLIEKLVKQFWAQRGAGKKGREALIEPMAIVLSSPSFLYLSEPSKGGKGGLLTEKELAVRLAYFLWSSPPDATLLQLAKERKLSKPWVLKAEVNRMLTDPRSDEWIRGFVHQWLHMDRLDIFQFESRLHPEFDETIRESARKEVFETVRTLLREDLPIGTLLKADFAVVNDALAEYYDLPKVVGQDFQKVSLPEDSIRGGLLGSAAIHAMGSDGVRSSPVERGAWVLRYLLHDPPPPAPANVPQLSRLDGDLLPARKLLEAHMEEPQCAQCHKKIDPIGYGLQHFDAAGLWREEEAVAKFDGKRKKEKTFPISAEGTLPNGKAFTNFAELRDGIAAEEPAFARGFTEALIGYALGRPYGFTDHDLATSMVQEAQKNDFRINTFIHSLVQSEPFRTK
ncbi:MAG: DUF1592 domain-containing protein [Verrucomicrobiota bacterium]